MWRGLRTAALLLIAGAAVFACSTPVRLASPNEIKAAQSSPAPHTAASPGPIAVATPATGAAPGSPPPAGASAALSQLQAAYRAVVDAVLPSVVEIDVNSGTGAGVVMDAAGNIVTNAHVVAGANSFTVRTAGGQTYSATLVATYPSNDLAVIRASAGSGDGAPGLKPATFADSSQVHAGDLVLAVGSPLGLTDSVSEGIVSATGRTQDEGNGVTLTDLIQTTAAINPGNSGGALVDISGRVIGIPTLGPGTSRGTPAPGIGFAISSNQVLSVTRQAPASGSTMTPASPAPGGAYLGIQVTTDATGAAVIAAVVAGGPADQAGVPAGSTLVSLGGHQVTSPASLSQVLAGHHAGDVVALVVQPASGGTRTYRVTLGAHP